MNGYGPLFEAQLYSVCNEFQACGGKFRILSVGKFDTQIGPTCGLVAVRVAAMALKCPDTPSVGDLLEFCQQKGYTRNGECFSTEWLGEVVGQFLPAVDVESCDFPSPGELIATVLNGGVYLIPYDSDKNFGPCNANGKSSHWFVLTGFFVLDQDSQSFVEFEGNEIDFAVKDSDVHVIGYQGKSRNMGLWSYEEMKSSNNQLNEWFPTLHEGAILPDGGIIAGLKGRVLRIESSKQ